MPGLITLVRLYLLVDKNEDKGKYNKIDDISLLWEGKLDLAVRCVIYSKDT